MSTSLAVTVEPAALPALIDRAAAALTNARSAAEVLEARDMASFAYDTAKKAARLAKAKQAHDELVGAAYRAQADASEIEATAKRRIADEYDAAQERGEVAKRADGPSVRDHVPGENKIATTADIGLSRKDIHEARILRDAEEAEPGIVRRALDEAIEAGEEPTRTRVMRAALKASKRKPKTRGKRFEAPKETQHDRDLRALLGVWESSCESARRAILDLLIGGLRAEIESLPAQLTRDRVLRGEYEEKINALMVRLSARWDRAGRELQAQVDAEDAAEDE